MNDKAFLDTFKYSTDDRYYCPPETDTKGYK